MKKILLGIFLTLAIQTILDKTFDSRAIIFEKYDKQEFQKLIAEKFLGKNMDEAIKELIASRVVYMSVTNVNEYLHPLVKKKSGYKDDVVYDYYFKYCSSLISSNPSALYTITLQTDVNKKIIEVSANIHPFWGFS